MSRPRRILYVQHAGSLGGSCVSLRYLVESLDRSRFEPIVALIHPSEPLERFYASSGAEIVRWPGILTFEHTALLWTDPLRPSTWLNLAASALRWRRSERRTLELVRAVAPELVHLNSAVLLPSARALHRANLPFVWHVREGPARGIAGVRHRAQREALLRWPAEVVFLTESERRSWVSGRRGRVIRNVVDLDRFDPRLDRAAARERLGLAPDARVVLYAGGLLEVKGVLPLLEAIRRLRERDARVVCLMPGAADAPLSGASGLLGRIERLGSAPFRRRLERALARAGSACVRLPFTSRVEQLLAASDLLVFPALSNHFARPIVEAGAMERPVVASRFPITEEQVGEGGILVPPGDAGALAGAIGRLIDDPELAARMGRAGRLDASRNHDVRANTARVMELYDEVLARGA